MNRGVIQYISAWFGLWALVGLLLLIPARRAQASVPAGGLDIFADHWFNNGGYIEDRYHQRGTGVFNGPVRISTYALTITGIDNNNTSPAATAFTVAGEAYLMGPFSIGGSFGVAGSDDLDWTHSALHGTMYVTPFLAIHLGAVNEGYDYPNNTAAATDLASNNISGFTAGTSLIGSPAPGFFFELGAWAVPVDGVQTNGVTRDSNFSFRADGLFGLSVYGSFDLSVFARATSGLGDNDSTSIMAGVGGSYTF